jgi:hypothetical protein
MRRHCCDRMRTHVQVLAGSSSTVVADRPVLYDPVFDEYRLAGAGVMADRGVIARCPWCGIVLPPSQRDRWFAELNALGLTPDDLLPDRFHSDDWWRDRNDHEHRADHDG